MDYPGRLARLREIVRERGAAAAVVTCRESVRYLTGFAGSCGDVVVTRDAALLVTDGRYELAARRALFPGLELRIGPQGEEPVPVALAEAAGSGDALFEAESVSVARHGRWAREAAGVTFIPIEGLLEPLRARKDPEEIALIRKACAITDGAWEAVQPEVRPGATEMGLARRLIELQLDAGADASAFPPIVASGPNSAYPHHVAGRRMLAEGDLVKVDFGCAVEGYQSDLTRTVVLGEPTELMARIYELVHRAQLAGCAALRAGASGAEADRAARSIIEDGGFGPQFGHGLGHGLGLAKDPPHVRPGYTLSAGNVVSIEPGIYIEGLGGVRIEDLLLVTDDGAEALSHASKSPALSPGREALMEDVAILTFRTSETAIAEIAATLRPPLGRRYAAQAAEVSRIVADVAERGDEALLEYVRRFDWPEATAERLEVGEDEIAAAVATVDHAQRDAVRRAVAAVRAFHQRSIPKTWVMDDADRSLGQRVQALRRVGMYVPGGIPLASTVYMCAVPARVAGVREIVMVTPSKRDGGLDPLVLAAARESGVDRIFRVGSAWAIAALAYGTATIPAVDKIVGPGGIYVMLAMREVFGQVGIDSLPGPSDILVLSDGSAPAAWIAADLLSQAEHGENSSAVLCTPSLAHLTEVRAALASQLDTLPTAETARRTLADRGALILCRDLEECAEMADAIAPEHLEIIVEEGAAELVDLIPSAGAIFLGASTPEPIGDYVAGPSHVLPTEGAARFLSPLSVESFLKRTSLLRFSREALARHGRDAITLAEAEGLAAHARSVSIRLEE